MANFAATHVAIIPDPPKVKIVYYDPEIGHPEVGKANAVEKEFDGRDGTLLQGEEKQPVPVFAGDAIIQYEKPSHVFAAMRKSDVSAWYAPLQSGAPQLPADSEAETV